MPLIVILMLGLSADLLVNFFINVRKELKMQIPALSDTIASLFCPKIFTSATCCDKQNKPSHLRSSNKRVFGFLILKIARKISGYNFISVHY